MATRLLGLRKWMMVRDEVGYREYKGVFRVESDTALDGPFNVLNTPGLPLPGSTWNFGDDYDPWVWCLPNAEINFLYEGERCPYADISLIFSNRPPERHGQRCQDAQIEDPLLEPMRVNGTFIKYNEEATHNRFGFPITNSAHEVLRGPQVEFDKNRPSVRIEQNVASLQLALFSAMVDTVNIAPLWGLPRRCIKLSNATWERKFYGQCEVYYTRVFEFDINRDTFDRNLLDEGTKVLSGHWSRTGLWVLDPISTDPPDPLGMRADPDRTNPAHFIRYIGRDGNPTRVILNGYGEPYNPTASEATPDGSIAARNDCGGSLGSFTSLSLGVTYGIYTIGGLGAQQFFRANADNPIQIVLITTPTAILAADFIINIYDAGCGLLASEYVSGGFTNGNKYYVQVRYPTGGNIHIGVEALGNGFTYNLRVEELGGTNAPGTIHVEKYGESNFLLLGIPTSF